MSTDTIQEILALIEKPSRYLGSEINAVKKDPQRVKLRFALAFPDLYEIGTSHFGLQILYHILNRRPEIAAERVFAPATDLEDRLRQGRMPLFSLESRTPLNRFDIIGFSLLYELNYTNVITMLALSGIPPLSGDRGPGDPLVVAGGPCTCNPEPVADFFDAIVVGDGEPVVLELARTWLEWKDAGSGERELLLKMWSAIEGVYIPSFFEARYDAEGFQTLAPRFPGYASVKRAVVADLDAAPFPVKPVIPFGKPVHDRLRLELSRGCTRGCRFCQAGMIYRPVRERSPDKLLELTQQALAATGYEDVSLMSLSTGDYGCIVPLMERLMARFAPERVAVSLPSLRAGTLTPELMELIRRVRKTGFTIAPEAGSQRLRDAINKNISEAEIIDTVRDAFECGWQLIKLYFMVGLPTETEEDLAALVELVLKLSRMKGPARRRGQINVSLATFIPKPHTPFQWAAQIGLPESRRRLHWIQDRLKRPGIQFKWQNPEMSLLEGVWARGDRRLGRALLAAHRRGCRFDGWSDKFNFAAWMEAFEETGVDPAFYTSRARRLDEPLPWDPIDTRVSGEFLKSEWAKTLGASATPDCRGGDCQACGVCDFQRIAPRVHRGPLAAAPPASAPAAAAVYKQIQVSYEKIGLARFFGHLELVNIFLRALRRARIPVKFSEGFHPKPKVSFDNPLPTGVESEDERMVLTVPRDVAADALREGLNAELPEGLRVRACSEELARPRTSCAYRVSFAAPLANPVRFCTSGIDADRSILVSSSKGKLKKFVLKDILINIRQPDPMTVEMTLCGEPGKTVRPAEILKQVFGIPEADVRNALVRKLHEPEA
ncbi:MAG: TIGR03960 family B12-binding radical SAM protein [Deltaproteobacteria bacterium]|nr:TIGR03960 family B12-binding radical SAM protein [Deltaproteobacteria bacterium]